MLRQSVVICYGNRLSSLNVSNNAALRELNCAWNNLSSLDVSNNTLLEVLCCNGNSLTEIDISKSPALVACVVEGSKTEQDDYISFNNNVDNYVDVDPETIIITDVQPASVFTIVNGIVTAYNGAGGAIEIPAKDGDGNAVIAIGEAAFKANTAITAVSIPASVTTVGESAFEECSALESVTIPNGVSAIGKAAFKNCEKLKSMSTFGE